MLQQESLRQRMQVSVEWWLVNLYGPVMLHQSKIEGQHDDSFLNQVQKNAVGMAHDGLDLMCNLLVGRQMGCQGGRGIWMITWHGRFDEVGSARSRR